MSTLFLQPTAHKVSWKSSSSILTESQVPRKSRIPCDNGATMYLSINHNQDLTIWDETHQETCDKDLLLPDLSSHTPHLEGAPIPGCATPKYCIGSSGLWVDRQKLIEFPQSWKIKIESPKVSPVHNWLYEACSLSNPKKNLLPHSHQLQNQEEIDVTRICILHSCSKKVLHSLWECSHISLILSKSRAQNLRPNTPRNLWRTTYGLRSRIWRVLQFRAAQASSGLWVSRR